MEFITTYLMGPVGLMAGIGLIAGFLLAIASIVMAVPVDEKAKAIEEVLPQANCGGCGFTGCADYAAALSTGKTEKTTLCAPGGEDVAAKIAAVLGVEAGKVERMSAVVRCNGRHGVTGRMYEYSGAQSCSAAAQLFGGPTMCAYGCLGLGDCMGVCEYDAINMISGRAVIDPTLCKACSKCVETCPKGLIKLMPALSDKKVVLCMNKTAGADTRKACKSGCIGCGRCAKTCPSEAVVLDGSLAAVDFGKCTACGKCLDVCPTQAIRTVCRAEVLFKD